MSETLYIRLSDSAVDSVQWLIWSPEQNEIIASGELASAQDLVNIADKAQQRKVVVLVSSSAVALKHLHMPAKSDRAMRAATPYALEDDLADDVDSLFFAYGKKPTNAPDTHNCFVAIVRHQQLENWLAWLGDAGIHTKVMIPDVLALPEHDQQWTALTLGEQAILRYGPWSGAVVESSWLPFLLGRLDNDLEQTQTINNYSPMQFDEMKHLTLEHQSEELPMALLAQGAMTQSFNLLQGKYRVKEKSSPLVKGWLVAASVAIFALLLNLTVKGIELFQLNNKVAALDSEIIQVYKKAFPETQRVRIGTIRSQLNGKLRSLSGGEQSVSFLAMLQKLEPSFATVTQIKPISIRFDGARQTIRLQASANSYQSFDRFKLSLEQASFEVTPGAQNNQGDEIVGSFTIRSKS